MATLTIKTPSNQELLTALKNHFPNAPIRHIAENFITQIVSEADGTPRISSTVVYSVQDECDQDDWYYMVIKCSSTNTSIQFADECWNYEGFDMIDEAEEFIKQHTNILA